MAWLFAGNTTGYFSERPSPRCVRRPVTLSIFRDHLDGAAEIGTYPVRSNATCRWGCIDVDGNADLSDDGERRAEAELIRRIWWRLGVVAWVERSRSKGYHIWVFAADWCPARTMRAAGSHVNRLASEPSDEVNPKNPWPWTTANGLVNTVRMPYPGSRRPGRQTVLDRSGADMAPDEFAAAAMARRTTVATLTSVAALWTPVRRQRPEHACADGDVIGMTRSGGGRSGQDAALILAGERRIAMGERDTQFHTIARLLHARNVSESDALAEVERVWRYRCDHAGYDLDTALEKVERAFR